MNTAESIAWQLTRKFSPVAVILHGSRAVEMNRPHSDWDVLLLFSEKPELTLNREEIAGQDVEWKAVRVPVAENAILSTIGVELQFGRVLWEDESRAGTRLLVWDERPVPKAVLQAMPIIRERDPEYHDLLLAVSAAEPNQAKIAAATHVKRWATRTPETLISAIV